jgi:hypothetical protein
VWKRVFQNIDIPEMCQGLMKMVERMENEDCVRPRVKLEARSPRKIKLAQAVEVKVTTNKSGAKVS